MSFPNKMEIPYRDPLGLLSKKEKEARKKIMEESIPLFALLLLWPVAVFRAAVNRFDRWLLYKWLREHSAK